MVMRLTSLTVFLVACGTAGSTDVQPPQGFRVFEPQAGPFEAPAAVDADPDPRVIDVSLEAVPADITLASGLTVPMWTYNGIVPGPRIEANVGDTVRIRFRNLLPDDTTIHWHGVRVPADMDGVARLSGPVASGETTTYTFVVPDAGTFWYHPHVRADEQVERGLYGAFIVHGPDEAPAHSSQTLVLDDLLLDQAGELPTFEDVSPIEAMVGRQGDVLLVNGRAHPLLELSAAGRHHLRLINVATSRYFRLSLPGYRVTQIATDGGLLPTPRLVETLMLVPGERAEVLVESLSAKPSDTPLRLLPYERGHETGGGPEATVMTIRSTAEIVNHLDDMPERLRDIEPLPEPALRRRLVLGESGGAGPGGHGDHGAPSREEAPEEAVEGEPPTFSINGRSFPVGEPFMSTLETVEEWAVVNDTEMDHPFHVHGFRFQLVDATGAPERAYRDTVNVPAKTTVRLRMRLEDHPGRWMFHCHILEHAERGMMGEFEVSGLSTLRPSPAP